MPPRVQNPAGVADVVAPGLAVIFCGINPSSTAAASGHNFSSPSNRFWKTLYRSGFTPRLLGAEQERSLLNFGCGITAAVARPTPRASDLTAAELADAIGPLAKKIRHFAPRTVAFLGKAAYLVVNGHREIAWGRQEGRFGGAGVWVLPNPSGLNRSFDLDRLVMAYSELQQAVAHDLHRSSAGAGKPR